MYCGRGFDSRHLHHIKEYNMFKNWFKKKEKEGTDPSHDSDVHDAIEESLWEIKEEYDLPTEEIINMVHSKRKNLHHMHLMLSKKENINKENI
jgi:hypothetical protein